MIEIGLRVSFVPHYKLSGLPLLNSRNKIKDTVTGTICYINTETFYFTVEYRAGDTTQYESFKFEQIGQDVHICK